MKQKKVAIIGVGLIGGSLGMALRAAGKYRVIGIGRDARRLALARRKGAADEVTTDWARGVADADIIVICTPVDTIADTAAMIMPYIKATAILTDAGSVKLPVAAAVEKILRDSPLRGVCFVGGHPMAGNEKAGVEHASPRLFCGATVVLTPGPRTPSAAVKNVAALWRAAGARIILMTSREHDRMVALTSHLPHMLAFGLSLAAGELVLRDDRVGRLAAGSFRDATRVADSNPRDWAAICHQNRNEIIRALEDFIVRLRGLKGITGDPHALERIFTAARAARRKIVLPKKM